MARNSEKSGRYSTLPDWMPANIFGASPVHSANNLLIPLPSRDAVPGDAVGIRCQNWGGVRLIYGSDATAPLTVGVLGMAMV